MFLLCREKTNLVYLQLQRTLKLFSAINIPKHVRIYQNGFSIQDRLTIIFLTKLVIIFIM